MSIVITGFKPFGQDSINPSWLAVQALPDKLEGVKLIKVEIDTDDRGVNQTLACVDDSVTHVINVGLAAGRNAISFERVALNVADYRIADNAGKQYQNEALNPNGPDAYFSSLPIVQMVEACRQANIPAVLSDTAGLFVCNRTMYLVADALRKKQIDSGFIHVPAICEMSLDGKWPTMPLSLLSEALKLSLLTIIRL